MSNEDNAGPSADTTKLLVDLHVKYIQSLDKVRCRKYRSYSN
jgi:hypothetical protein